MHSGIGQIGGLDRCWSVMNMRQQVGVTPHGTSERLLQRGVKQQFGHIKSIHSHVRKVFGSFEFPLGHLKIPIKSFHSITAKNHKQVFSG